MTKTNTKLTIRIISILFMFLLTCCSPMSNYSQSVTNNYNKYFQQINITNIKNINVIRNLERNSSGRIGAIGYNTNSNTVMVVNVDAGELEIWGLESGKIISNYGLGIVTDQGLQFNLNSDKLVGATYHEYRDDNLDGNLEEYISGINVWDTKSGNVIHCFIECGYKPPSIIDLSAGLDHVGNWVYAFNNGGLVSENIETDKIISYILISLKNYNHPIGRITLDSDGMKFAIAYQEGGMRIRSQKTRTELFSPEFENNVDKDYKHVLALSFSPIDKWLARIRENKVTIWRVFGLTGKEQYEVEIPFAKLLVFDNTEHMLFVSSEDTVSVIDINKKEIVTTLTTPNITALGISQDNRLLLWGDSKGGIHVWGIQ